MGHRILVFISGMPGSGKSTLAERIAREFQLKPVFASHILKKLLNNEPIVPEKTEKGQGFWESQAGLEACEKRAKDVSYDIKLDKILLELAHNEEKAVFDSRMLPWLYKGGDAFKVWIDASLETRAVRVAKRDGIPIKEALKKLDERFSYDVEIYRKVYNVDIANDRSPFDLVLKTDLLDAESVFEIVALAIRRFFKI